MRRFLITVLFGSVVYTVGCILTPPREDTLALLFIPVTGAIFTALAIVILLLPLRAGLRALLPQGTQRTHGILSLLVFVIIVTAVTLLLSPKTIVGTRVSFWTIWTLYFTTLVVSFFWPFAGRNSTATTSVPETTKKP